MMQAVEKKSIPGFFDEAVYPAGKSRQLVCHRFPTCGSRPILRPHSSTGSDRYTGMIYIRDQRSVRKLTLNPSSFWEFFDRVMVSGCLVSSS